MLREGVASGAYLQNIGKCEGVDLSSMEGVVDALSKSVPSASALVGYQDGNASKRADKITETYFLAGIIRKHIMFFASTFWKKLQAKMEKVESPFWRKLQIPVSGNSRPWIYRYSPCLFVTNPF